VRFHSWQSIFLTIAYVVIRIGLMILGHMPFIGLMLIPVSMLIGLAFLHPLADRDDQGLQRPALQDSGVGDFAEKQANS
jgi:uncharacterized membrane protein